MSAPQEVQLIVATCEESRELLNFESSVIGEYLRQRVLADSVLCKMSAEVKAGVAQLTAVRDFLDDPPRAAALERKLKGVIVLMRLICSTTP